MTRGEPTNRRHGDGSAANQSGPTPDRRLDRQDPPLWASGALPAWHSRDVVVPSGQGNRFEEFGGALISIDPPAGHMVRTAD